MTERQPQVGIGVFVWRDDKFLVCRRAGAHGEGTWSIPGGKPEFGESWEDTAKREVFEETGMQIRYVGMVAVTNDIFEADGKHFVTIWVKSEWTDGEPTILEPEKCTPLTTFLSHFLSPAGKTSA